MEVNSRPPKQINSYWLHIRKKTVWIAVCSQILIAAALVPVIFVLPISHEAAMVIYAALAGNVIISVLFTIWLFKTLNRPLKDLLSALIYINDERTALTPPNQNEKRYSNTGFDVALRTVYETTNTSQTSVNDNSLNQHYSQVLSALDTTDCGFITFDANRNIQYSNKAAPIQIDQSGQKKLNLLFNGDDTLDAWLDECAESAVHAEKVWVRVPDSLPNQENRRFFDVFASYEKGATSEAVITLVDRTDSYSAEEEDLNFISFAAHELRGPITVIRGYIDVLQDELEDVLQDDQSELFRRLSVSASRLSGYVNNILNTSRYDRRHLKIHLVEDTVTRVYSDVKDDMQLRASSQGRLLSVIIPEDLPTIAADRGSLSEVFSNLIDNAVKYSNEGGTIVVSAEQKGDFVEISVKDSGIGMPGNVMNNLFQKFYRSHRSRETVSGTGIGLYITKAIVDSHGGSIRVTSEEGKGSTFIVAIPTYASIADKLAAGDNSNEALIDSNKGWIKNHAMFKG